MAGELIDSQEAQFTSPEAVIEQVRVAYVRGEMDVSEAALRTVSVAMMAFPMQRVVALAQAEALSRSLVDGLAADVDETERTLAQWTAHSCAAVSAVTQAMRAVAECRYERLDDLVGAVEAHCAEAKQTWGELVRLEPDARDTPGLAMMVGSLDKMPLVARMMAGQGRADRHLFAGQRTQYVRSLGEVLKALEAELRLPMAVGDTSAFIFRPIIATAAESIRARLAYLGKQKDDGVLPRVEVEGRRVFIVHGHDEAAWRALKDMLEKEFGLEVVVLKQQASASRTVIEKFEDIAGDCSFAFALVTPDDMVKNAGSETVQARPNVLFELGWFYGRFGPSRLIVLKKGEKTQLPSDLGGIVTLVFNESVSEQYTAIRDELRNAGLIDDRPKRPARRAAGAKKLAAPAPARSRP